MDPRMLITYSLFLSVVTYAVVASSSFGEETTVPVDIDRRNHQVKISIQTSESKVSKRYTRKIGDDAYEDSSEDEEIDGAPPDHVIPYSEHENPEEPATKPKYTQPGDWAKPPPDRNIPLNFVPTKLYTQVRKTHTVKRVPRIEAYEDAETPEEVAAADRLREVVSKSKANTVYSEEGYEDAAYDHGGHIRDADYNEGYDRGLNNQRNAKKRSENKPQEYEDEEADEYEGAGTAQQNSQYEDDDDKAEEQTEWSSKLQDTEPVGYKNAEEFWKSYDIDPKRYTMEEIAQLKEDVKSEYEEIAKNTDIDVPENLKNPGEEYEENEDKPEESRDTRNEYDYGNQENADITESDDTESEDESPAELYGPSYEKEESENSEISRPQPSAFSPYQEASTSQNSRDATGFQNSENVPEESPKPANYGNVFWDYFKLVGNGWKPRDAGSIPNPATSAVTKAAKSDPEEFTIDPDYEAVKAAVGDFKTSAPNRPKSQLNDFEFANRRVDPVYPSAGAIYDSWKAQTQKMYSQDIHDSGIAESASDGYPIISKETIDSQKDPTLNLQHGESSTTLIGPKKLSYTVIIRSNDKTSTTTKRPPCIQEDGMRNEESNSHGEFTNKKYRNMLQDLRGQINPEAINDFALQQDLTVVQPPLPVPLGQVTFADFLSHPYANLAHPSVTQESEQPGQESNGGRDQYIVPQNPYENPVRNHVSHASEVPHVRPHRGQPLPPGRKRNHHHHPPRKLVPPSPVSVSKYAEYYGVKRSENSKPRPDRSLRLDPWPGFLRLYRSIDQTIFGNRRRRSIHLNGKIAELNTDEKVYNQGINVSNRKILRPERDLFQEEASRLVGNDAATTRLLIDGNLPREKSVDNGPRRTILNDEDLLNEAPRIVDEVINAEIESRFQDNETEGDENNSNQDEDRGKVEVEVPDFNYAEVIENNKRAKLIIDNPPRKTNVLDVIKYPFYNNADVPQISPLKYVTNPSQVPKKTRGGTEFYDSRDRYLECAEVEPNLEGVVPEDDESSADHESRGDQPRLQGLGDKLDCFAAKYFDENPFDNPLFLEKRVGQPQVPEELDATKISSRIISIFINNKEEEKPEVMRRSSKSPEMTDIRFIRSKQKQMTQEEVQNNQNNLENDRNSERRQTQALNHRSRIPKRHQQKEITSETVVQPPQPYDVTPYQKQVYEDVMGTIKNLASMYQSYAQPVFIPLPQANVYQPTDKSNRNNLNFPVVHITERPRGFMIQGLLPPQRPVEQIQTVQRYRIIPYRTNKVSYRTRARTESPPGSEALKVGYFKTVRVHKRSIDDSELSDLITEESRNIPVRRSRNSSKNARSVRQEQNDGKSEATDKIVYTIHDRIRHSKPRDDFGGYGKFPQMEAAGTEDVRRLEPRYNKIPEKQLLPVVSPLPIVVSPLPIVQSNGHQLKLPNPLLALPNFNVTDTTAGRQDFLEEPGEIYKIQFSTTMGKQAPPANVNAPIPGITINPHINEDPHKELREIWATNHHPNLYHVHEKVEEKPAPVVRNQTNSTQVAKTVEQPKNIWTIPPEYSRVKASVTEAVNQPVKVYVIEEPKPIYDIEETKNKDDTAEEDEEEEEEADEEDEKEDEEAEEEQGKDNDDNENEKLEDEEDDEEKEDEADEEEEEYGKKSAKSSSDDESGEIEEDSSSNSPVERSESEKSPEDDEETEEEEEEDTSKDVDGSHVANAENDFERFKFRPSSPFENYEDPKYADLGPRVSKPAFYHPTFSKPKLEAFGGDKVSGESEGNESDEEERKNTSYVLPWDREELEGKEAEEQPGETRRTRSSLESYEYPWETRERLTKERKKKEKELEKKRKNRQFSKKKVSGEEEQDVSSSNIRLFRVFPWENEDMTSGSSQMEKVFETRRVIDNDEMSSEYRPVTRFSSRYKLRPFDFVSDDDDPIVAASADASETKVSLVKSIIEAITEKTIEPNVTLSNNVTKLNETVATTASSTISNVTSTTPSRRQRNWTSRSLNVSTTTPTTSTSTSTTSTSAPTTSTSVPTTSTSASTTTKSAPTTTTSGPTTTTSGPTTSTSAPTTSTSAPTTSTSAPITATSSTSTTTTTARTPRANRRGRIWRVASTTTKKPIRSRKRTSNGTDNELLMSDPQKKQITTTTTTTTMAPAEKNTTESSVIISPSSTTVSAVNRKTRRRGQSGNRTTSSSTTSTMRPTRKRTQKKNEFPKKSGKSTFRNLIEKPTTPKSKTIEHRSRFSKEEIITKTSYPESDSEELSPYENDMSHEMYDSDEDDDEEDEEEEQEEEDEDENEEEDVEDEEDDEVVTLSSINDRKRKNTKKKVKNMMNESVEKVSIVTKETPEHIYRTEEIDKDGVKGKFVSITPNNRNNNTSSTSLSSSTSSLSSMEGPEDRSIDGVETKKIIKTFENYEEDLDVDPESSFMRESHLLANLLRQVQPYMNDLSLDENLDEGKYIVDGEGSGGSRKIQEEDDANDGGNKIDTGYVKHPNHRLYYYVEKRKR